VILIEDQKSPKSTYLLARSTSLPRRGVSTGQAKIKDQKLDYRLKTERSAEFWHSAYLLFPDSYRDILRVPRAAILGGHKNF